MWLSVSAKQMPPLFPSKKLFIETTRMFTDLTKKDDRHYLWSARPTLSFPASSGGIQFAAGLPYPSRLDASSGATDMFLTMCSSMANPERNRFLSVGPDWPLFPQLRTKSHLCLHSASFIPYIPLCSVINLIKSDNLLSIPLQYFSISIARRQNLLWSFALSIRSNYPATTFSLQYGCERVPGAPGRRCVAIWWRLD